MCSGNDTRAEQGIDNATETDERVYDATECRVDYINSVDLTEDVLKRQVMIFRSAETDPWDTSAPSLANKLKAAYQNAELSALNRYKSALTNVGHRRLSNRRHGI
jgi:hypothetical protein